MCLFSGMQSYQIKLSSHQEEDNKHRVWYLTFGLSFF